MNKMLRKMINRNLPFIFTIIGLAYLAFLIWLASD